MKKEDWISPAFQKYVSMVAVQDLLKRVRKPDILLLRPLWAPLGVLSGTEELFVFIPPQHESVYVVGGVFQTILVQHPGALGKAHTRQPVVLCYDHIPRFDSVDQRKVYAVDTLVEYHRLCTLTFDLVRGVAQDDDRNAKPFAICNVRSTTGQPSASIKIFIDFPPSSIERLSPCAGRRL